MAEDKVLDEFEKIDEEADEDLVEEEVVEEDIGKEDSEEIPSDEELAKTAEEEGLDKSAYTECMKEQMKAGKSMAEAAKYCKAKVKSEEEKSKKKPKEYEYGEEEEEKGKKKPKEYEYGEEKEEKAASVVDILEQALKSDDLAEVKAAIKKAIKALKETGYGKPKTDGKKKPKDEEYGYGYPAAKKIEDALASLDKKLEEIKDLVKQAPAEGASDRGTPKEEAEKASEAEKVSETKETKVEAEKALEEEVGKTGTSSEEALLKILSEIKERLKKIEEQPAPSKVVVSKSFVGEPDVSVSEEIKKIDARLAEIASIRDHKPFEYTDALADEAIDLIKRRKALERSF